MPDAVCHTALRCNIILHCALHPDSLVFKSLFVLLSRWHIVPFKPKHDSTLQHSGRITDTDCVGTGTNSARRAYYQ